MAPALKQCSTPRRNTQGATSIAFEENQLSPSLISLSLLSTPHPLLFQQEWVRASSTCYRTFTLDMDRSPGFGSIDSDLAPYSDSVSLRLPFSVKLATAHHSLTHYTKGTQSHRKKRCSYSLYACGFRFYFTPLSGVLFAFPSRYWFTIGQSGVFSLGGWSPLGPKTLLQTGFHVSRPTFHNRLNKAFMYRAITLFGRSFQYDSTTLIQVYTL